MRPTAGSRGAPRPFTAAALIAALCVAAPSFASGAIDLARRPVAAVRRARRRQALRRPAVTRRSERPRPSPAAGRRGPPVDLPRPLLLVQERAARALPLRRLRVRGWPAVFDLAHRRNRRRRCEPQGAGAAGQCRRITVPGPHRQPPAERPDRRVDRARWRARRVPGGLPPRRRQRLADDGGAATRADRALAGRPRRPGALRLRLPRQQGRVHRARFRLGGMADAAALRAIRPRAVLAARLRRRPHPAAGRQRSSRSRRDLGDGPARREGPGARLFAS